MTSIRLTLAAASPGSGYRLRLQGIVFTSQQQNAVRFLDSTGSVSTLYASVNPDTRFANVTAGPTGEPRRRWKTSVPEHDRRRHSPVDMPFSGSASAAYLTQGNPLQKPVGLTYDSVSGNLRRFPTQAHPSATRSTAFSASR